MRRATAKLLWLLPQAPQVSARVNANALRAFSTPAAAEAASTPPPPPPPSGGFNPLVIGLAAAGIGMGAYAFMGMGGGSEVALPTIPLSPAKVVKDYDAVRNTVGALLDAPGYDDGSMGPVLVRLAWHTSGTYDKSSGTGGSNGATMRFSPECEHGANAGLAVARAVLEPVKAAFPWISYADLWTLAGAVAIEEMGGPHIKWRPGRSDKVDGTQAPPDGRLPDAAQGQGHVRDIFYRMGFDDQEIVALVGAHTLGRCHTDRSGFDGPWSNAPTTFSNLYFQELANNKWTKRKWNGPAQYEDKTKTLMMLPSDMAMLWDKKFKKYVDMYAKDDNKFYEDFAAAFSKLLELGVTYPEGVAAI